MAPGIDYTALWAAQRDDDEVLAYRTAISGLLLEDVRFGPAGATVQCDGSTDQLKPGSGGRVVSSGRRTTG